MTRQFSISNIRVTKIIFLPSLSSILFANIILKFTLKFVTKQSSNWGRGNHRKEGEGGGKKRKEKSFPRAGNVSRGNRNSLETIRSKRKVAVQRSELMAHT